MRSLFHRAALAATAILLVAPAMGSTSQSWAALDREARKACSAQILKQAGKAKVARATGRVLGIGGEDGDRHYALLLSGRVAGYTQDWLCLYDKRSRKVSVRDIEVVK